MQFELQLQFPPMITPKTKEAVSKPYVGEVFPTNNCGEAEVIDYNGSDNVTIRFLHTGAIRKTVMSSLRRGSVRDTTLQPSLVVGGVYTTNSCGNVRILDMLDNYKVSVKFLNTGYITDAPISRIRSGSLKDPLAPTVCGVGRLGMGGKELKATKRGKQAYKHWSALINRCYNEKSLLKNPTYTNVTVSDEWKTFTNFYKWWDVNFREGFELDKDILAGDNKIYASDSCCYIPKELNNLFRDTTSVRGALPEGVSFSKRQGKFTAYIGLGGIKDSLGYFTDHRAAERLYRKAKANHLLLMILKWGTEIDLRVSHKLFEIAVDMRRG